MPPKGGVNHKDLQMEKDLLISDIFFNLMSHAYDSPSRKNVSELAGIFSKTLHDIGIEKSPSELRQDFFDRL
jgi:hypothetical protein